MIFTIDTENAIMIHTSKVAAPNGAAAFSSPKEFERVSADWPTARLVEIWNGFAGAVPFDDLKPVKKFTNRQTGVKRIWEAIQRMQADVPAHVPDVAPKKGKSRNSPPKQQRSHRRRRKKRQRPGTAARRRRSWS